MTIAIIGLGLIGGSLAKVIKERTAHKVLGFDSNETSLVMAYEDGAIDNICTDFKGVDLVFIALYPAAAVEFIKANSRGFAYGSTIIDLCGVKRFVCDSLKDVLPRGVTFVGGHPMAGRECSGFENAASTLFDNASMILTPDEDMEIERVENLCEFFIRLGFGHVEVTTPERHDEVISYTSQLAHVVSSAYVKNPVARKYVGFSAGSFKDMTRVAKLNEEMWAELFLHNADFLQHQIDEVINNLAEYRNAIAAHDRETLTELLRDGRELKESLDAELNIYVRKNYDKNPR